MLFSTEHESGSQQSDFTGMWHTGGELPEDSWKRNCNHDVHGNLRSGTQNWCGFHYTKNKESAFKGMLYYGIILMFIIGAIIGNAFVKLLAEKAILICAAVLFMAFIMMFVDKEKALEQ